jgi:hypothetical protein
MNKKSDNISKSFCRAEQWNKTEQDVCHCDICAIITVLVAHGESRSPRKLKSGMAAKAVRR